MKLTDLKGALIQQFFKNREGIDEMKISDVISSLGEELQEDVSFFDDIEEPTRSHDPSKAFAKFVMGQRSILLIEEEEPYKKIMIYGAMRSGKKVVSINLTDDQGTRLSSLGQIKEALHQAKALNDDICYSIINEDRLFETLKEAVKKEEGTPEWKKARAETIKRYEERIKKQEEDAGWTPGGTWLGDWKKQVAADKKMLVALKAGKGERADGIDLIQKDVDKWKKSQPRAK